jgi:hypothetical protein
MHIHSALTDVALQAYGNLMIPEEYLIPITDYIGLALQG